VEKQYEQSLVIMLLPEGEFMPLGMEKLAVELM
jgi:hypothetical protein